MSQRSFEEVNKEYALECAKLGELELQLQGMRKQMSELNSKKNGIYQKVESLAKEANVIQAKLPASPEVADAPAT